MSALVLRADARQLPLPDASVDLIVTSPPYYGLRSYTDGGEHYEGQIGSEATPAEWLQVMLDCTREWMRVLKPTGSIWVNLGDKYDSGTSTSRANQGDRLGDGRQVSSWNAGSQRVTVGRPKSLLGLPWRYALACVDDLGLTLRAEVIWSKPNGLPESVTDRVRRTHEQWFHFTMRPRYYAAVDEIREQQTSGAHGAARAARRDKRADDASRWPSRHETTDYRTDRDHKAMNPLGKLPASVWEIASEPLTVPAEIGADHFAAFPMEWPRRIIQGWSPAAICTGCGEARQPIYEKGFAIQADCSPGVAWKRDKHYAGNNWHDKPRGTSVVERTGEACGCAEPTRHTRSAVVLDPFGGTGTTALVASALGRVGITVDRSADYCRIARWRTTDPAQRAKALGVDKPPAQLPGQHALFDLTPTQS